MQFVSVPEAGVPRAGVTKVGEVAKTRAPDPVSSDLNINPWEDIKESSKSRFEIFIKI